MPFDNLSYCNRSVVAAHQLLDQLLVDRSVLTTSQLCDRLRDGDNHFISPTVIEFV
jgi:hypothetical protein